MNKFLCAGCVSIWGEIAGTIAAAEGMEMRALWAGNKMGRTPCDESEMIKKRINSVYMDESRKMRKR